VAINWKKHRNSARQQIVTVGTRNIDSGMIGSAARFSCQTKAPSTSTAAAAKPRLSGCMSGTPWPTRVIISSSAVRPTANSNTPGASIGRRWCATGRCRSVRRITSSATSPSGRLIQKIQRHDR